jgi:hypothetical protein
MVALILTRRGFDDMRPRLDPARDAVWVGADVLTAAEVEALRTSGINLTTFVHPLDPQRLDADIGTVRAHHPGQVLWVETEAG